MACVGQGVACHGMCRTGGGMSWHVWVRGWHVMACVVREWHENRCQQRVVRYRSLAGTAGRGLGLRARKVQ